MKERPILFQGEMVRALLRSENPKTQTRRLVQLRPGERLEQSTVWTAADPYLMAWHYGQPGDQLWVKETFFPVHLWKHAPQFAAVVPEYLYRADYEYREPERSVIGCHHWKPSIFMPRAASRCSLEIAAVRIERLQDISEADALAEGIEYDAGGELADGRDSGGGWCDYLSDDGAFDLSPIESYRSLWDMINAKPVPVKDSAGKIVSYVSYPWAEDAKTRSYRGKPWRVYGNPFVWRIEFKKIAA